MTKNDIIRMAREAGGGYIDPPCGDFYTFDVDDGTLERFAALVAASEREACAKVCEERLGPTATDFYGKTYAAAIRARGQE